MRASSNAARKAAYLFLSVCVGALLALIGFRLYEEFGPSMVSVDGVPFGIPVGSKIERGDSPDFGDYVQKISPQSASEFRRAMELFRSGANRSAYEIFDAISLFSPDFMPAVWGEVNTLYEMDSLTEVESERLQILLLRLKQVFPNTGISVYLDSRRAYVQGNKSAAMDFARIASEKSPALYEARLWYARLLMEQERMSQAIAEARTAISLSAGNSPRSYEMLARMYHDSGDLDSCASVVEYALTQYPMNCELMLIQGFLAEYRGNFDMAEKLYQRIIAFKPEFTRASAALSTLGEKSPPGPGTSVNLTPRDKAQMAIDILEPLVERYPENLPLREALGLALLKGREFDRAKIQFQEIFSKDSDYPDIKQRLQEADVTKNAPVSRADGLAENLNRALDSLREKSGPSVKHDFSTMLGHYLVRYGSTPGEFFKKYAVGNFRPVRSNVWQESFYEDPYKHTYTVVFDSLNHFREVHVMVYDSSTVSNHMGMAPEVYSRLLKQNSRISGIGNSTGETDCGDGVVIDAAVWETQDNFEILARFVGVPAEVRMVRFDKTALPPGLKLCDYVQFLREF